MREHPDLAPIRVAGLLGVVWGVILVTQGREVWSRVEGGPPAEIDKVAIRLLGARHLGQGAAQLIGPGHFQRTFVTVDVIHAGTMLALAAVDRGRRRSALLTAGVAAASAAITIAVRGSR
ncbi:MAG TPA: hypothetical protein VGN48_06445 [Pedococcus sp.]|jgi:hypothetical protein|nr:hypothetical protein [Pedococcus sp.]